jgi:hypothetical protein
MIEIDFFLAFMPCEFSCFNLEFVFFSISFILVVLLLFVFSVIQKVRGEQKGRIRNPTQRLSSLVGIVLSKVIQLGAEYRFLDTLFKHRVIRLRGYLKKVYGPPIDVQLPR